MSLSLVRHLWRTNRAQIVANSIINCHALGLHSLCLLDEPGRRIRMFVAEVGHDMARNKWGSKLPLSVGFHSHHCDVQLEVIAGEVGNRLLVQHGHPGGDIYGVFRFRSALRGEVPGFDFVGMQGGYGTHSQSLFAGDSVDMKAAEQHTVWVATAGAVWIVYEGAEDPNYEPLTVSDANLAAASFDGMYLRMQEPDVIRSVEAVLCERPDSFDLRLSAPPASNVPT